MSGQHTPGPWAIVEDRSPSSLEVFGGGAAIAELWRRADVVKEKADARLIAAAPWLLEAMQELLDNMEQPPEPNCSCHIAPPCNDCLDHSCTRGAIANAKDAIAKATGEQP